MQSSIFWPFLQNLVVQPQAQFSTMCHNCYLHNFREFASSIQRPFGLRYNPYTQSVEVLSNAEKIAALVSELRGDLCIVSNALRKIHAEEETVESITHMLQHGINVSPSPTESDNEEEMQKFKSEMK